MNDRLQAWELIDLINTAIEGLRIHKDEINDMNVFPVPDGDTGTNMLLTMQAVQESIGESDNHDMASICRAIARGSLMGARGNSGVVLSQIFKGMTEVFSQADTVGVGAMASALSRGSEVAYRAVMKPVEGTILTVVRDASEEGERVKGDCGSLEEWLTAVVKRARESLKNTPELLPVLKEAGVVDAGGRGLVVILEGILACLTGEEFEVVLENTFTTAGHGAVETNDYRYEAQFMLHCRDSKAQRLREKLQELGGSVLVVGDEKQHRVHVHTNKLGRVIEEASNTGRMSDVEITDLMLQVEQLEEERARYGEKDIGVVAVAVGEGIKDILRSMGVDRIVDGGQSMNPSTAEILAAIDSVPQKQVILIPNNKNIIPAAEQTRDLTDKEVVVIPAVSITEGFSSMVAFDPREDLEINHQRILHAMAQVKTGAVTVAVRDGKFKRGRIREGECIGLFSGEIVAADGDVTETACSLLETMVEDGDELATVIVGEEAGGREEGRIIELLEEKGLEVEVINGGQPVYHYIFGVE